jgi:hypothetical protein
MRAQVDNEWDKDSGIGTDQGYSFPFPSQGAPLRKAHI